MGPPLLLTNKLRIHCHLLPFGIHGHPATLPNFFVGLRPLLLTLVLPLRGAILFDPIKLLEKVYGLRKPLIMYGPCVCDKIVSYQRCKLRLANI